jgi:protease IV
LNDLKKTKPVYVSFGTMAASGGYYISCLGEKIFTLPSTITGSIGVVSITMSYKDLSDKLGINFETIKKHQFDDFLNPNKKADAKELSILNNSMAKTYDEFTGHVSKSRNINKIDLSKIAEGRVWTGNQSVKNKLTDEIKGLLDSIDFISKTEKIDNYSIVSYPKTQGLFSMLQNSMQTYFYNQIPIHNTDLTSEIMSLNSLYDENKYKPVTYLPFYELP